MKTSLIIPAYNEAKRLRPFLISISKYYQRHSQDIHEIILVDDGSSDQTLKIANKFKSRLPILKTIARSKNQGKGAAVRAGVLAAKGDQVVFMDADGATDISELPKMIQALRSSDIAVGNRWMPGAQTQRHSSLRALSGWLYRVYMKLFGLGQIDTMCGFKGYQKPVARKLFKDLIENRWLFDTEVAYKSIRLGFKTTNFPIRWESKDGSKLTTRTLIKSALSIWPLIRKIK